MSEKYKLFFIHLGLPPPTNLTLTKLPKSALSGVDNPGQNKNKKNFNLHLYVIGNPGKAKHSEKNWLVRGCQPRMNQKTILMSMGTMLAGWTASPLMWHVSTGLATLARQNAAKKIGSSSIANFGRTENDPDVRGRHTGGVNRLAANMTCQTSVWKLFG